MARHAGNQFSQLLGLLQHLGQQEGDEQASEGHQHHEFDRQGCLAIDGQDATQQGHGHIQGHRQDNGAKKHQQYPAQLPGQQPEHNKGKKADQDAGVH